LSFLARLIPIKGRADFLPPVVSITRIPIKLTSTEAIWLIGIVVVPNIPQNFLKNK